MNPVIRGLDRMRPAIFAAALGIHVVAAIAMPDFAGAVSSPNSTATFVEMEAVLPPVPPPEVAPEPEPEPEVRASARPELTRVERTPEPVVRTEERVEEPTPQPTPAIPTVPSVADTTPVGDPLTASTGSVAIATTGRTSSSGGGASNTSASGQANTNENVVDRRAIMRSYRGQVASSIRLPPLRGSREAIDTIVVVGMRIASNGEISDVRVVRTSGHPVVDAHVVDYFRGLRRLPPPPSELELSDRDFVYQVRVGS